MILARPYRLRAETRSAYYLVRVLADPDADSTRLTTTDRLASVAGHDRLDETHRRATGRGVGGRLPHLHVCAITTRSCSGK